MFQLDVNEVPRRALSNLSHRVTVAELAQRLWAAKIWALAGAVLFGAACILIVPFIKPVYEASTQIYVDPQNLQLLRNDLTPALSAGDSGVVIAESQVRIMQSASVLKIVVEKLGLTNDEEFGGKAVKASWFSFGASNPARNDPVQEAVERLSKNINVVREDRTYMITVYGRSRSPQRAADISNAVIQAYLQLRDNQRTDQANSASSSLEGRLTSLQTSLKAREDAVAQFKVDNRIVDTNGTVLAEGRLGQNNVAVSAAEDTMNKRKVDRDQLQELLAHPEGFLSSPIATASPDLLRLRGELQQSQADLSTLAATLGERHPRVLSAKSRVAAISKSVSGEMSRLAQYASIEYDRAKAEYQSALKSLDPLISQVQNIDSARVQLRQLQREADSARAVYEEALTRSRETREQGLLNTLNAQVISAASPPIRRKSPPSFSVMLILSGGLGFCLGWALGVGYGLLRDQTPYLHGDGNNDRGVPPSTPLLNLVDRHGQEARRASAARRADT